VIGIETRRLFRNRRRFGVPPAPPARDWRGRQKRYQQWEFRLRRAGGPVRDESEEPDHPSNRKGTCSNARAGLKPAPHGRKRYSFGTPTPASSPPSLTAMVCWKMAAQAASSTTSNSVTGRRWAFHDGRNKITITLLIRKACDIQIDFAGNGNGAVVAETGGVIGIPVPRSPGASDRPDGWCSRGISSVTSPRGRFLSTTRESGYAIHSRAVG